MSKVLFPKIGIGQKFTCGGKVCTKTSETQATDGKTVFPLSMFSSFYASYKDLSKYLVE